MDVILGPLFGLLFDIYEHSKRKEYEKMKYLLFYEDENDGNNVAAWYEGHKKRYEWSVIHTTHTQRTNLA